MKSQGLMSWLPYIYPAAYAESQLSQILFFRISWVGNQWAGERGSLVWEQVYRL